MLKNSNLGVSVRPRIVQFSKKSPLGPKFMQSISLNLSNKELVVIEVMSFKQMDKGSLKGFLSLKIPTEYDALIIRDVSYFEKEDQKWISFPSKEYMKKDGKKSWIGHLYFESKDYREAFQKDALEALDTYRMNAFNATLEAKKAEREGQDIEDELPF